METVDHHVQLAKAYTEQGMLVRSELLRAEVERARIQALLTEARGQARVAEANLSFRLATDTTTHWELVCFDGVRSKVRIYTSAAGEVDYHFHTRKPPIKTNLIGHENAVPTNT